MKIVIVSQAYAPDPVRGAERVAAGLAEALKDRHEVHVIALGDEDGVDHAHGYPVHRLAFNNTPRPVARRMDMSTPRKMIWHVRNAVGGIRRAPLQKLLGEIAPDVVYLHNVSGFQPQMFRVCKALKLPVVSHLHDYTTLCTRKTMYRGGHNCETPCASCRALTGVWKAGEDAVGDVIAITDFVQTRHQALGHFPKARWHRVYNADQTSLEGFSRKTEGPFTFGYIGALSDAKGIGDLISSFEAIQAGLTPGEEVPQLVLAGSGMIAGYVEGMQARTADLPISWLGQVPPNALYSRIDCLIVPSRWHEPQGLVVAEALRRGLPIIGTRRGGITEVLEGRAEHSLYEPDAEGALTEAMRRMMQTPRILPSESVNDHFVEQIEQVLLDAARKET